MEAAIVSAMVGSIVTKLINLGCENIKLKIKKARTLKQNIRKLYTTMLDIRGVLEDNGATQFPSKGMEIWLTELKTLAYAIDDVLDAAEYHAKAKSTNAFVIKVLSLLNINTLGLSSELIKEIDSVTVALDNLNERNNMFGFNKNSAGSTSHTTGSTNVVGRRPRPDDKTPTLGSIIYGRDEATADVITTVKKISADAVTASQKVCVYPIVGMGGSGKTALAKLVYGVVEKEYNSFKINKNESLVKHPKDDELPFLPLWACVSGNVKEEEVIEDILKLVPSVDFKPNMDLTALRNEFRNLLNDKKYFLVLDDVNFMEYSEQWVNFKDMLQNYSSKSGSVILVTTRYSQTANQIKTTENYYPIKKLSEVDSQKIFRHFAFTRKDEKMDEKLRQLYEIGDLIVKKCCGNPLVLRVMGGLLTNKRSVKQWHWIKNLESLSNLNEENYNKNVNDLLQISYDELPAHLKPCFAYLSLYPKDTVLGTMYVPYKWCALGLLPENKIEHNAYKNFQGLVSRALLDPTMELHNLYFECTMHDLWHDVAVGILGEERSVVTSKVHHNISEKTKHIMWGYEMAGSLKESLGLHSDFNKASKARTFRFNHIMYEISESLLNDIISKFKCVRILELGYSWFKTLPGSVGELVHLRYLNLSHNDLLEELPQEICKLINLVLLSVGKCMKLKNIPKDIHKLLSLRSFTVTTREKSLKDCKLNKLMSLYFLEVEECKELEELWGTTDAGDLPSLGQLYITNCPKLKSLPNDLKYLDTLELLSLKNTLELNLGKGVLINLPSLRVLIIDTVTKMTEVPDDISAAQASLQRLTIRNCPALKGLPQCLEDFKCLRTIKLLNCPELDSFPLQLFKRSSLTQEIVGCPHLERKLQEIVVGDGTVDTA